MIKITTQMVQELVNNQFPQWKHFHIKPVEKSGHDDRHGYIIVSYGEGEEGPYISKISLVETTPYLYDMRPNRKQIAAALAETDIDLSTASGVRVEWIDTEKNRGDRIILFTDGKNDKYLSFVLAHSYLAYKLVEC